jgi:phenylalanyl-tRNA synthetase beta chain
MKLTLGWLKEHLETDTPIEAIAERLTMLGLEVEQIIDRAAELAPFTVAYVEDCAPHPNADRLKLCKVDTGAGVLEVVCGAPNARTGMKGVFAPIGARLPGTGLVLEKRAIRGVTGHGMLCSEREMGLSDEHEGIIELPEDAPVGAPFAELLGLDDPVLDIAVTPDRGDCLGVLGIARDLAAAGAGRLVGPVPEPVPGAYPSPIGVRLEFTAQTASACPLFIGRHIRGVRNGPSPAWLQRRLRAVGLRPISTLVDVTNFVTLDRARPLHAFDADALAGSIHLRLARAGERLAALDERTYDLDPEMCVVADDDGPVSLGGVIGGTSTGCTADTVNVFVEAAWFDPVRTAATGRKLGIDSDARYRFERGADRAGTAPGMELATRMILELCGGEASEPVVAGAEPPWGQRLDVRPARVHALGGLDLPKNDSIRILDALGFAPEDRGEVVSVRVPSWRNDIDGEADIVEEVLRVEGFDAIPPESLPREAAVARPALDAIQRRAPAARRCLAARGLEECVTWSFLSARHAGLFGGGAPALTLANPISTELTDMRPSVLPNLIAAAGRNADRGFADFGLFEVGPVYADDTPDGQTTMAGGIRAGRTGPRNWLVEPRAHDAFDAKADALAVLSALGLDTDKVTVSADAPPWYHPGRSGVIRLGPKTALATFGELHPRVLEDMDVAGPMVAFEVHLAGVPQPKARPTRARPAFAPSDLPAVNRDFAFVVPESVAAAQLLGAVRALSGKPPHRLGFTAVDLFDVYAGEGVPEGHKSLAVSVTIQPAERTLTEDDIQAVSDAIVAQVEKATGGKLRG